MNASEHATRIHSAAMALNRAVSEAQTACPDLRVEMDVREMTSMRGDMPHLTCRVWLELK